MRTSRDLNRYLALEARLPRQAASAAGRRDGAKLAHAHAPVQHDVEINGHEVSVIEDDVGVVELQEE